MSGCSSVIADRCGPVAVAAVHSLSQPTSSQRRTPLVAPAAASHCARHCAVYGFPLLFPAVCVCAAVSALARWPPAATGCCCCCRPSRRSSGRPRAASRATGPERRGRKQARERDEAKRSEAKRRATGQLTRDSTRHSPQRPGAAHRVHVEIAGQRDEMGATGQAKLPPAFAQRSE